MNCPSTGSRLQQLSTGSNPINAPSTIDLTVSDATTGVRAGNDVTSAETALRTSGSGTNLHPISGIQQHAVTSVNFN